MKSSALEKAFRSGAEGFGLVETVIGSAIMGLVLLGLAQIGQFVLRTVDDANLKVRGAFLAEEGIEAARILRDTGWSVKISPVNTGQPYYLNFSGGVWVLEAAPQPPVDGVFNRQIVFSPVSRDASDNIVSVGGVDDPDSRKVSVTVSWTSRGRSASVSISTYLTNLFDS